MSAGLTRALHNGHVLSLSNLKMEQLVKACTPLYLLCCCRMKTTINNNENGSTCSIHLETCCKSYLC
ncbi:hypothetical protein Hanom_Chr09g00804361 [Helianthus anomalus]